MSSLELSTAIARAATGADTRAIAAIDARHSKEGKAAHWRKMIERSEADGVGCVVEIDRKVVGYVFGEVRAWEFGSPATGWIHTVGVDPDLEGHGVGRLLIEAAKEAFAELGVTSVRTMIQRDSVELLRFFRSAGFVAGPFVELEVDL